MDLLLLHGALGARAQLDPVRQRTGGIAIDLTGHGERDLPSAGLSFGEFVADIERTFEEQGWERADLFGYSMGGYAALLFAAKHPTRVRSVVTVGTKYLWTREGLQTELRMLDPDKMLEKVPVFAQRLSDVHGEHKWRALVMAVAKSMSDLATVPLLTDQVKARITCRVLLCVGDGDTTAVPEDTITFSKGLPNAQVQVLPNTKHPFETVDLEALAPLLRDHWARTAV